MGALTCHDVIVYNIVHDVIKCFVARAQNLPSNGEISKDVDVNERLSARLTQVPI
jgi:hypothetical protein